MFNCFVKIRMLTLLQIMGSCFSVAVVRCRARQRVERRVEVLLTGIVPGATAMPAARNSAMVNTNKPANIQEEVQVTDGKNK